MRRRVALSVAAGLAGLVLSAFGLVGSESRGAEREAVRPGPSTFQLLLEVASDYVVVNRDVLLPRTGARDRDWVLFHAYGAPGAPLALDGRLYAPRYGVPALGPEGPGRTVPFARLVGATSDSIVLAGDSKRAGVVFRVRPDDFDDLSARSGAACLRLRFVHMLPDLGGEGWREVVVLMTDTADVRPDLGMVALRTKDSGTRIEAAQASWCTLAGSDRPIALWIARPAGYARASSQALPSPIALPPEPGERLCIRFRLAGDARQFETDRLGDAGADAEAGVVRDGGEGARASATAAGGAPKRGP